MPDNRKTQPPPDLPTKTSGKMSIDIAILTIFISNVSRITIAAVRDIYFRNSVICSLFSFLYST